MRALRQIERIVNGLLGWFGIKVVRRGRAPTIGGRRMSDEAVIRRARSRGLSPGEYLEELFDQQGRAERIIERVRRAGALSEAISAVCEIGPGSGLYIEKVLERVSPRRYEVYEIAQNRADYLGRRYPVVVQRADGETLSATATGSIDLVHAHGVFVTLPFLTNCSYFSEIARVMAPGGHVVFDVITDACLDPDSIDSWMATPLRYLSLHSHDHLTRYFAERGFSLIDEFAMPLLVHGTSRYFIFRRKL